MQLNINDEMNTYLRIKLSSNEIMQYNDNTNKLINFKKSGSKVEQKA